MKIADSDIIHCKMKFTYHGRSFRRVKRILGRFPSHDDEYRDPFSLQVWLLCGKSKQTNGGCFSIVEIPCIFTAGYTTIRPSSSTILYLFRTCSDSSDSILQSIAISSFISAIITTGTIICDNTIILKQVYVA